VLVSASEASRVHVARSGLAFAAHADCSRADVEAVRKRARGLSLEESNRVAMTELFAGVHARAALPGLLATAREWRPDVIVRETAEFTSVVVAEALELPAVHVAIFLAAASRARTPSTRCSPSPARPARSRRRLRRSRS
jgi:hypothetical protein